MKKMTRENVRFKLGLINNEYIDIYYYNDYAHFGYREKLGLATVPGIQISAERTNNKDDKIVLNFKVANYVLILWTIIILGLYTLLLFQLPLDIALIVPTVFLTIIYFIQLNGFSKQLFYFKYDLQTLEKRIQNNQNQIEMS